MSRAGTPGADRTAREREPSIVGFLEDARTHDGSHLHPHFDVQVDRRAALRAGAFGIGAMLLAACSSGISDGESSPDTPTATSVGGTAAAVPAGFESFADSVHAFTNGDVWMVESNGLPMHPLMIGIESWQQQVPVAQDYTGNNAWQFPITPELADEPVSARTGLFRGAIALAVNGVPIFNALNNRGDDAFLVGELDDFGGHCGRADDYHYHVAPMHLEEVVGAGNPIAYALDGFAIYGSVEPDGSAMEPLDEYNGHTGTDGVYHYHGTSGYPYINGGLVGVVSVSDQVEPQPSTPAFRPAGEPLAGATITAFERVGEGGYRLEYAIGDEVGSVEYTVGAASITFVFTSPSGEIVTETYER